GPVTRSSLRRPAGGPDRLVSQPSAGTAYQSGKYLLSPGRSGRRNVCHPGRTDPGARGTRRRNGGAFDQAGRRDGRSPFFENEAVSIGSASVDGYKDPAFPFFSFPRACAEDARADKASRWSHVRQNSGNHSAGTTARPSGIARKTFGRACT